MKIAIQNIHKLSGLAGFKLHNYAVEMVKRGHVDLLYFDDPSFLLTFDFLTIFRKYRAGDLGLLNTRISFDPKDLDECDVLLNFESSPEQFTPAVKNFKGLKIFHAMDYFWYERFETKLKRLREYGIDYVMGYSSHDLDDPFFMHMAPEYKGKTIPVPFGYTPRFSYRTPFNERKHKCAGIGSAQPMALPESSPEINWKERADFFAARGQKWFHPFRRALVEHKEELSDIMDSYFPEHSPYVEYRTDMTQRFNDYQMFVCDESALNWPTAKSYEGPVSGCVMVCSDHPCFTRYGFEDGANCVKHKQMDIADFRRVVTNTLADEKKLNEISQNGKNFIKTTYSQQAIADKLYAIIKNIYEGEKRPVYDWAYDIWKSPHTDTTSKQPVSMLRKESTRAVYNALGAGVYVGSTLKQTLNKILRK